MEKKGRLPVVNEAPPKRWGLIRVLFPPNPGPFEGWVDGANFFMAGAVRAGLSRPMRIDKNPRHTSTIVVNHAADLQQI